MLLLSILSCSDREAIDSRNNIDTTSTTYDTLNTTIDTIGFWGKESSLYNEIILRLPIEIDSSNVVGRICGNEPKCYSYTNFSRNLTIEFCQYAQTIKDYYISPKSIDQLSINRLAAEKKSIEENLPYYKGKPVQKVFASDSTSSADNSKWYIGGSEFLMNDENNSMLVTCVNTKTDYTKFFIYTSIHLRYDDSKQNKEDAIRLAKFICQNTSAKKEE